MKQKAYFNWSSGKDSALALYKVLQADRLEILTLFSVVQETASQIAMHATPLHLLEKQAESLGIPLTVFRMQANFSAEAYKTAMRSAVQELREKGAEVAVFGDICLEEIRKKREKNCREAAMQAAFPLWNMPARELLWEFISLGFRAVITCVDASVLDKRFVGREIDEEFIRRLPPEADMCGENGEYHSFVFDGPIFRRPVAFRINDVHSREYPAGDGYPASRFWYADFS